MLLNLCEQVGAFPTSEREVLISLYRKPKGGGRRPIAGFRALYRIWGRARKSTLQTWERQHAADGFFNTGAGRKCSDGVWRAEVRGELATGAGSHYAVLLWDLVKAFEMVDHQLLIQEADKQCFPFAVLQLILQAFEWPRRLILDGLVAEPLYPGRAYRPAASAPPTA